MKIDKLRKEDFYIPVLQTLQELGRSGQVAEIDTRVIEMTELDEDDLEYVYPTSGALMAPHKIAFARSYLRLAGLLKSGGRGIWVLTEKGAEFLGKGLNAVLAEVANATREYHANRRLEAQSQAADTEDGEAVELQEEVAGWEDHLISKLQSIEPDAFERLCQRLLREYGFTRVEVTGKSGDGGIDGHGVLRVNLLSFQVLFQSKRYKGSVSCSTVRDFRGAMQGRADKGLIITTGTFTAEARKEATRDGAPAIDLIDGDYLCELMKEKGLGVNVRQVVRDEVTINEEFFEEI